MEILFLIDANIFLAILLRESKDAACRDFLSANPGQLHITDFSLHSIGLALPRLGKADVFKKLVPYQSRLALKQSKTPSRVVETPQGTGICLRASSNGR